MGFQSDTIRNIVEKLNLRYFLPAIQREFVWDAEDIIRLFDSVMRGYPISSFLFWELKPEDHETWEVYRFVQSLKEASSHNELANTSGVPQLTLVLDGQQRLTSLLIGLKGSFTVKKKYKRRDSPDAWVTQILYLDLMHNPDQESDDSDLGLRYGFHFLDTAPKNDKDHYWFKVGKILDFDNEDKFDTYRFEERGRLPGQTTLNQSQVFERNLYRIYQAIWKRDTISYYTETDSDPDRVLDIFVRANSAGTPLSKSDLLLSMVTSKWTDTNAREQIYGFVKRINNDLDRKNNFDKDFVMKACLVLSDLPVQYRVKNFNNHNLALIEHNWKDIRKAIETAITLVNSFGIDRDTLTSTNALIPIAYYLYQHPKVFLRGSSSFDVHNATRIRTWLVLALLNRLFGRAADGVLQDARRILQEHNADTEFALDPLNARQPELGRKPYGASQAIENLLEITYGRRETFLALSLLYDDMSWGLTTLHQDHIFPRASFTQTYMDDAGIAQQQQLRYLEEVNSLANLELLLPQENHEKSNQPFETWLGTRNTGFKRRHLIPESADGTLYRFEHFLDFVSAREAMIVERLKTVLALGFPMDAESLIESKDGVQ